MNVAENRDLAFTMAIRGSNLPSRELADGLLVGVNTINRWKRGLNLPHESLRGAILNWIDHAIDKRTTDQS